MGVAARDERGDARQRGADQRVHFPRYRVWPLEACPVPRVGYADRQVHVVRDHRRPVARQPAAHGPVVAAERDVVFLDAPRRLVLEPGDIRARGQLDLRFARSRPTQVVDLRTRYWGCLERQSNDGGIPLGPGRRHQGEHLGRQHFMHRRQAGLVVAVLVLQREEHRQHHEHAVLGAPGGGGLAQQRVLERRSRQRLQAGIHAEDIRVQHPLVLVRQERHGGARLRTQAMKARPPIRGKRLRTHEGRQLSGGAPARQIHLKKAVLCVQEARGARHILPRAAPNCRNAQPVPLDDDGRRQPRQGQLAVQRGQAPRQTPVRPPAGASQSEHQKCARPRRDAQSPPHCDEAS